MNKMEKNPEAVALGSKGGRKVAKTKGKKHFKELQKKSVAARLAKKSAL